VYTDCSCGTARGERFTPEEAAGRQKAFDAALALARSKGKWLAAWAGPALVRGPSAPNDDCVATMRGLIALGANASMGMQLTAGLVAAPHPHPPGPAPAPGLPLLCGDTCSVSTATGTTNHGIVAPPIEMADQQHIAAPASVAACCERCKALSTCEVFGALYPPPILTGIPRCCA
jgi:hypothetical protein